MACTDPVKRKAYHKKYGKQHYEDNKEKYVRQTMERRRKIRDWFMVLKASLKCARCPENDVRCLDFHHRDYQGKDRAVSILVCRGCSKETILAEIAKCDVLC